MMRTLAGAVALAGASALALVGCGGGGGGGSSNPSPPPPASTYTVSVTVSGLAGSGLVLRNNGGDNLAVSGNGTVSFATALTSGGAYAVTVGTQPSTPTQTCTVTNGNGTIGTANVTTVAVNCATNRYAVSASVNGLSGSGLLLLQGNEELAVTANGTVPFPTQIESGARFEVRVARQPVTPNQRCNVTDGSGQVTNAAVSVAIQCVDHVPRFAYSVDFENRSISIFAVDGASGQLRHRGYVNTGRNPVMFFPDPQQRFWFALSQQEATVSVFRQDPVTADLTEVPGSPYATGGTGGPEDIAPTHIAVHPGGKFFYVVNGASTDDIAAFSIDQTTGALTAAPGSPFKVGADPSWLKFDASGRFAYVSHRGTGEIWIYSVDATTGALAEIPAGSRVASGTTPGLLAFTSNSRFAYVTNSGSDTVAAFSVNTTTGGLTPVAGSPFAVGPIPSFLTLIHPSDKFLYAHGIGAPDATGTVSAFSIDPSTGVLTPVGTPSMVGRNSTRALVDPGGQFLFVANRNSLTVPNSGSVSAFRIDQTTGGLTMLAGITNTPTFNIEVDPSSKFLYVTGGGLQRAYSLNPGTGELTLVTRGGVVLGRRGPLALSVYSSISNPGPLSFSSRFAFVPNGGDQTIRGYSIDATTGSLTTVNTVPAAQPGPRSLAVHPGGRFLVASHSNNFVGLASYPINTTTGALSAASGTFPTDLGAGPLVLSPNGRNVYVLNTTTNAVQSVGLDANGVFSNVEGFNGLDTSFTPLSLAMSPNGRAVHYVTSTTTGFGEVDGATGSFTGTGTNPPSNSDLLAITFNPQGTYAYVTRSGSVGGSLLIWRAADPFGLVQVGPGPTTEANPTALVAEPTGRYLYVVNTGSNSISQFRMNQLTGH